MGGGSLVVIRCRTAGAITEPGGSRPQPWSNLSSATTSPPWAISAPTSHLIRSDLTSAISRWTPAILALVSWRRTSMSALVSWRRTSMSWWMAAISAWVARLVLSRLHLLVGQAPRPAAR